MTDAALPPVATPLRQIVEARLKVRHAQERRFRLYGRIAIFIALAFLFLLVGRIVAQGYTTFIDYRVTLPVYVDPQRIIVAPDCGLKYLPREVAFGKLKAMVDGARLVRAQLERV